MRAPVKSESDAFRLTMAGASAIGVAIAIGVLTKPLIGVGVLALVTLLAAIAYLHAGAGDRPAVLRNAAREPHSHGPAPGTRHVLVIANEPLSGAGLREAIVGDGADRVEVDVLAPVLSSHVHHGLSDIDRELAQARARLQRSLTWTREQGIDARGEVGDPTPTTAIEDELRDFGADNVIVVTHARERETWQERGELDRLRRELDVPVMQFVVGEGAQPEIAV